VYWRVVAPETWNVERQRVVETEKRWKDFEDKAVDRVVPGDLASEARHQAAATKSTEGTLKGKGWRYAEKGGSFSYRLKAPKNGAAILACAYGSHDRARTFDVFVGDQKVASPQLTGDTGGEITVETYEIPAALIANQDSVTVRFQAGPNWNHATGTVFGVALVPQE